MMALDVSKSTLQSVGNYDLIQKVAEGGMGAVFKGKHRQTGQIVAIKIVPPTMLYNATIQRRFENEFRAASKLNHPNIVRALDYGLTNGRPFLVMEFVEGESLGQRVERDGRLPEAEALRIITLAAQGLGHAHEQGLIHRDVKPDNILVTPDGQVKLADLGLVKEVETDLNLTRTGRGLGTPHFMAPEQFRNAKNANVRCDIYSLGATLYQMVTGDLPFRGSTGPLDALMKKMNNDLRRPRQLVPELSERTEAAITRAMNPDAAQRPESCQEFIDDLSGKTTRKIRTIDTPTAVSDLWYLVYRDDEGLMHTVKGTTAAIRRSLLDGVLGDASNVRACRTKSGPFEPLRSLAEYCDLFVPVPPSGVPTTPFAVPAMQVLSPAPADSAPAGQAEVMPHIELDVGRSGQREWLKLLLVALVAMGFGMVIILLLSR